MKASEKPFMADNMGHIALTHLLLKKPRPSTFDADLKTTLSFAKSKMGIKQFRKISEQLLEEAKTGKDKAAEEPVQAPAEDPASEPHSKKRKLLGETLR